MIKRQCRVHSEPVRRLLQQSNQSRRKSSSRSALDVERAMSRRKELWTIVKCHNNTCYSIVSTIDFSFNIFDVCLPHLLSSFLLLRLSSSLFSCSFSFICWLAGWLFLYKIRFLYPFKHCICRSMTTARKMSECESEMAVQNGDVRSRG